MLAVPYRASPYFFGYSDCFHRGKHGGTIHLCALLEGTRLGKQESTELEFSRIEVAPFFMFGLASATALTHFEIAQNTQGEEDIDLQLNKEK